MFHDRRDAGRRLAELIVASDLEAPLVLALPRGGVAVGYEIARALAAPLDVFVARKLGAPRQPELAIGAIAEGGGLYLDRDLQLALGVTDSELRSIVAREASELERRVRLFRGDRPFPDLEGRTVILVDDGVATGATVRAAIDSLRRRTMKSLVFAVPVAAAQTAISMRDLVDDWICLEAPSNLTAVGLWYEDFEQVSDAEVQRYLEGTHRWTETGRGHEDKLEAGAGSRRG